MQDSPEMLGAILPALFSIGLLAYWYHRSKVKKLRSDLSDKDAVIRDLRQKYYDLKKRHMSANGNIPRRVKYEMENLSAKLDMLKDPMEEFRTRVEDIERDIAKLTKYEKGDER